MAKKSDIEKVKRKPRFSTKIVRRCWRCGRNHGYMKFFNMCRICIREMAERGDIPGMRKSSW